MKVKIYRQSGNPVLKEDLDRMMVVYKAEFDKILEKCGNDMEKVNNAIEGEGGLMSKLAVEFESERELEIELPKSAKKWKELVGKFGVVSIGTKDETGKLCLIMMDAMDSGLAY